MKTVTKTIAEYKAPKCKTVALHIKTAYMQVIPSSYYDQGKAGNGLLNYDPEEEDF